MGSGTQTSTTTNQPPADVLAQYDNVVAQANNVASTPYQPYTGQLVAGENGTQGAAVQSMGNAATSAANASDTGYAVTQAAGNLGGAAMGASNIYQPYFSAAQGNLGSANGLVNTASGQIGAGTGDLGQAASYYAAGAQGVNPGSVGASQINQYMSPYTQSVINSTMAEANQQDQLQDQGAIGSAISAGNAFGGDRMGLGLAALANQQGMANNSTIANLNNQNYTQALGEANNQQQIGLAAQEQNAALQMQAGQGMAGLGATAGQLGSETGALANTQGNLAQTQANMGTAAQSNVLNAYGVANNALGTSLNAGNLMNSASGAALNASNSQLAAGTLQQQTQQNVLNSQYQQFQNQVAFPYQQTGWLGNISEGIGSNEGGTSTTTSPAPFFSDKRLKSDAKVIGKTKDGQNIYRFRYKGDKDWRIGLMAQDVLKKHPDAVSKHQGWLAVDYKKATDKAAGTEDKRGKFATGGVPGMDSQSIPGMDVSSVIPSGPLQVGGGGANGIPKGGAAQQPMDPVESAIINKGVGVGIDQGVKEAGSLFPKAASTAASTAAAAPMQLPGATLAAAASPAAADAAGAGLASAATSTIPIGMAGATAAGAADAAAMAPLGLLAFLKRGGRVGRAAGGNVIAPAASSSTAATAPAAPTYGSTKDAATGITTPNMTIGGTTTNIPPPPQLQAMGSDTFGSIPQWENNFSQAQGAYYQQYPGAPGNPNPPSAAPATLGSAASAPATASTPITAVGANSLVKPNSATVTLRRGGMANFGMLKRAAGGRAGYDGGGDVVFDDSDATLVPDNLSMAAQYAKQMPAPTLGDASSPYGNIVPINPSAPPSWFSRDPDAASMTGKAATDFANVGPPAQGGTVDPSLIGAGTLPAQNAVSQAYAPSQTSFMPPDNPPIPPVRPGNLGMAAAPANSNNQSLDLAQVGPSTATAPATLASAATAPAPTSGSGFLASLQHYESGGRNIPNVNQGTTSGQAQGFNQITTGTWNAFAPRAGVDLSKYPTPMSAPEDVQNQVAATIPMGRWAPETLGYLKSQGYSVNPSATLGENIAANDGGSAGGTATAYTPSSTLGNAAGVRAINNASPQGSLADAASPSQSAAPSNDNGLFGTGIKVSPDMQMALLKGVFGMLASPSHTLAGAIGSGGLAGVDQYMASQNADRQNSLLKNQTANTNSEIATRSGQLSLEQQKNNLQIAMQLRQINAGRQLAGLPPIAASDLTGANPAAPTPTIQPSAALPAGVPTAPAPAAASPASSPMANVPVPSSGAPAPVAPNAPSAPTAPTQAWKPAANVPAADDDFWKGVPYNQNPQWYSKAGTTALANGDIATAEKLFTNGQNIQNRGTVLKNGQMVPIPGFNEAQAATAAAKAKAESDAHNTSDIAAAEPKAEQTAAGTKLAAYADTVTKDADAARDQKATIAQMKIESPGWNHGAWAQGQEDIRERVKAVGDMLGADTSSLTQPIANYQDFVKNSGNIVRQAMHDSSAGSRGGVQLATLFAKSLPSPEMTQEGFGGVATQMDGLADAKLAKQQALTDWADASAHPENKGSTKGFASDWNSHISPTAFVMHRMYIDNPQQFQTVVNNWSATAEGQQAKKELLGQLAWGKQHNLWND